jgi:hypothetical protein
MPQRAAVVVFVNSTEVFATHDGVVNFACERKRKGHSLRVLRFVDEASGSATLLIAAEKIGALLPSD